jgi:hypothetical protein
MMAMLVSELPLHPISSMLPEQVHSLDSVSPLDQLQDMFSRLMRVGMQVGKLPQEVDGDSLEMLEPILLLSLSEQQITKILYSNETISNHSVSLVQVGIS